jgi:hypothetical protein
MELIDKYFERLGETFCGRLSRMVASLLDCFSANTGDIFRSMSKLFGLTFHAADMYVFRFLSSADFQLDDHFWRCHVKLLFDCLKKHGLQKGATIQLNIDYTSIRDDFLVLAASVLIGGEKAVMAYFSMRKYPKRKGQLSLKKMEEAFLRALKHILPKGYEYLIVADRGFGNERIVSICEQLEFKFVLRLSDNLNVTLGKQRAKLCNFEGQNCKLAAYVDRWKRHTTICVNTKKDQNEQASTWFLVTNLDVANASGSNVSAEDVVDIYEKRFKIEKLFQDLKSSGFDVEKSKIKKYDRAKRLLYCIALAHALTTFTGFFLLKQKES